MQTKIKITGMHCASCKNLIEDVAHDLPGVQSCRVDQEQKNGEIEHDESFDFTAFVKEIEALGEYKIEKI